MDIGEEWIYRLKHSSPSERVRILAIRPKKTTARVDVEFLEDGRLENVPGSRLTGLWEVVEVFDALMAHWERIEFDLTDAQDGAASEVFDALMAHWVRIEFDLTDAQDGAASEVFDNLVPAEVATYEWYPMRYATAVHDRTKLEALLNTDLDEVLVGVASFDRDGVLMVSPEGTLRIAEVMCVRNSADVSAWVMADEAEIRDKCKRGRPTHDREEHERTTSPEWEYEWYLKSDKPRHELLRQWCGHRAVTFHERLTAAEAEVRRLDILIARLIESARSKGDDIFANVMEEEHNGERIAPERVRPVPDRPLSPHEIPVREVPVRRRWGY